MQLNTYQLRYPNLIDPLVYREMDRIIITQVTHADAIHYRGTILRSEDPLRIGETVRLHNNRIGVSLQYQSEWEAYQQWLQAEQIRLETERQRQQQQALEQRIQQSRAFYAQFHIPFAFTVEIKEVLSGLSARSWGDGSRRNTVYHIYLQEDYSTGKFRRQAGDFLCSQSDAQGRGNWSDSLGKNTHALDQQGTPPIVTCKACLHILERFQVTPES